jgi:hypothetical protein
MIRPSIVNHPLAPAAALAIAIGVFGFAVWPRSTPSGWSSAEAAEPRQARLQYAAYETGAHPVAYRSAPEPRYETSSCNPWDVSPAAMEAILQEMVRRGWQPPRSDVALAGTQPSYRAPIEALSPDQPVRVASPRASAPVETGEIVDVTIVPGVDAPEAGKPETGTAPATPSTPAPEPAAPEAPASN